MILGRILSLSESWITHLWREKFPSKTQRKSRVPRMEGLSLCSASLTHFCQKPWKINWDARRGTSFLFVCGETLTQTLTVIRTRWLLIVTKNQAKSSKNGRVSRCHAECEHDQLGLWGPEQPYLWACIATEVLLPENLPLFAFCVTSFQHLRFGGICSPKWSWELGLVS